MKKKTIDYHEFLMDTLKDPKAAAAYLNNAIEENDPTYFLKALRNVAEASGSLSQISKMAKVSRMTLYRTLSKKGNPTFKSLLEILRALRIRFTLQAA